MVGYSIHILLNGTFVNKNIDVFYFGKQVIVKLYFSLFSAFMNKPMMMLSIIQPSDMKMFGL